MTPEEELSCALRVINAGIEAIAQTKQTNFICQLANNNHGFSQKGIETISEAVQNLQFPVPTHISILPRGKAPSSTYLFDGFTDIYCNDEYLRLQVRRMKAQPVRQGFGK